jgi:hypothetical protein
MTALFTDPEAINMLRYLLALRINQPLVVLPPCLPVEIAYVLGAIITERLPTGRAKPWRKMQSAWEQANPPGDRRRKSRWPLKPPEAAWPLELAWLPYQAKRAYGQDELLLCELKLFGTSAAHELFLELILPALEEAGMQGDARWKRPRALWGRYHVQAVYVARGRRWEPVVEDGRLDFSYRPAPNQWAAGLELGAGMQAAPTRLVWVTPYDPPARAQSSPGKQNRLRRAQAYAPSLPELLLALAGRLDVVAPGWRPGWRQGAEAETAVAQALALAADVAVGNDEVTPPPRPWPGLVWGQQQFDPIPAALLPHLELASILHLGRQTQFGCGAFRLSAL